MHIIISALHFPWETIDDCFRIVREELGLDGIELSLHTSFHHPHCTREDLERLQELAAATGLSVEAHIWEDLAQLGPQAGIAALLEWLEISRQSGISGLVIHGGSSPDRREGLVRTRGIFAEVVGPFEEAGVVLKLENHYAYEYRDCRELFSEPWEFQEIFSAIDSPALRFCYDTGHGHMTHNGSELLRALAPYLAHIHLADNHGVHDDHCPYRQGTVPWNDLLALWREIEYDGTYCVEFPVRENHAPFRHCLAELRANASLR